MIRKAARSLPCVIGDQYILTAVVEETEDTIIYEATQKDLQREVLVESLRLSAMADEHRRAAFLETCRLQARVRHTSLAAGLQLLEAEAPQAEMFKYATDLRSMTQARGSFTLTFERYEEVPKQNQAKIIADAKSEE